MTEPTIQEIDEFVRRDASARFSPGLCASIIAAFVGQKYGKTVVAAYRSKPTGMIDVGFRFKYPGGEFTVWIYHFTWYDGLVRCKNVLLADAYAFQFRNPSVLFYRAKLMSSFGKTLTSYYASRVINDFKVTREP